MAQILRRLAVLAAIVAAWPALAEDRVMTLASTTSTEQSGLFGYLLPIFT
ncbi:MAG TPA: tungsten ABC transporter substrate-binding protein, partial [Rhodospirillaceae bacterium]|nr:tungsten ABC transporter substrate-binding protein [Rhodospirillaceae bacterium]